MQQYIYIKYKNLNWISNTNFLAAHRLRTTAVLYLDRISLQLFFEVRVCSRLFNNRKLPLRFNGVCLTAREYDRILLTNKLDDS
jgi:hypothetical protein